MEVEYTVNEMIRTKEVRLISETGEQLGVFLTREALNRARENGKDLVVVSDKSDPPVCKIIDFGKFKYELTKSEREKAKKQRQSTIETKEIRLRPVTDTHDLEIKAKQSKEFFKEGNKIKIVVKFKGREVSHADMGRQIIEQYLSLIGEHKIEKPIFMTDKQMTCIIAPITSK